MCDQSQLTAVLDEIANTAREVLSDSLESVILYGSYARGDFDEESDIDIMIRIDCERERLNDIKQTFIKIANALSLKHDVEIPLSLIDTATYNRYKNHLPYYENIEREGIRIA